MVKTASYYPVLWSSKQVFSRLGQRLGQSADPIFCPNYFNAKNREKVLKSNDFRTFLVAETGLEPATSGL